MLNALRAAGITVETADDGLAALTHFAGAATRATGGAPPHLTGALATAYRAGTAPELPEVATRIRGWLVSTARPLIRAGDRLAALDAHLDRLTRLIREATPTAGGVLAVTASPGLLTHIAGAAQAAGAGAEAADSAAAAAPTGLVPLR